MLNACPPAGFSSLLAIVGLLHLLDCGAYVQECNDDEFALLQVEAVVSPNATAAKEHLDKHRDRRNDPIIAALAGELKVALRTLSTMTSSSQHAERKHGADVHVKHKAKNAAPVIPLVLFFGILLILLAAAFATTPLKGETVKEKEADLSTSFLQSQRPSLSVRGSPRASRTKPGVTPGQTPTHSHSSPETTETSFPDVVGPPPVCRSRILPHTEARFIIGMDHLMRISTGTLNILGTSSKTLLQAILKETADGGRVLSIAAPGIEDDPYMRIFAPPETNDPTPSPLEVFSKAAVFYGTLERSPADQNRTILKRRNQPVMLLDKIHDGDLRTFAADMNGDMLATAARAPGASHHTHSEAGDWKLRVKPGVDAVLCTGAMLAIWLLQSVGHGRQSRPSFGVPGSDTHPAMYPGHTVA